MNKRAHTPWLLLLIGGGFLLLMTWSLIAAGQRGSAVTDRDYYSHGLRYNQTELERQAAAALGWTASIDLQGRQLFIRLQDRARKAVTRAGGALTLAGPDRQAALQLALSEASPGIYRVELPADLHGELPVRIVFERDGARLNKRLLLSLP